MSGETRQRSKRRLLFVMHKLLDISTAAIPTGIPPQRKILTIDSGPYAGRLFCLYNESPSTIATTYSDPPYTVWSEPYNHITDSANYPPSACIDSQGNIYVVYVQQTTLNLIFFRLPFSGGMWHSGAPFTILDTGAGYYPVITRNNEGELWCGYAYYDSGSGQYTVRVKSSTDNGQTWGGGPSDTGTVISSSSSSMPYVCLNFVGNSLFAVFSENRSNLRVRKYVSNWETAVHVYNGDYIDADFDCAVSEDMKLGIIFGVSGLNRLFFREHDGVSLGGLMDAYNGEVLAPQLFYASNKPYAIFTVGIGNNLHLPRYAFREGIYFIADDLIKGIGLLDNVLLYADQSATFENVTAAAQSSNSADIYHSSTNKLICDAGDAIYFGKESRFFCLSIILSISATGGGISWEYYDGQSWIAFTPHAGDYTLDEVETVVYLWNDTSSIPDSWQVSTIDGNSCYWIRARVTDNFTVAPVGSQIAATPKCKDISLVRGGI